MDKLKQSTKITAWMKNGEDWDKTMIITIDFFPDAATSCLESREETLQRLLTELVNTPETSRVWS